MCVCTQYITLFVYQCCYSYHMYQVEAGLYYGGHQIGKTQFSHQSGIEKSFFNRITWDVWLETLLKDVFSVTFLI